MSRTLVPAGLLVAGIALAGCSAGITTTDSASGSASAPAPSSAAPASSGPASGGPASPTAIPIPSVTVSGLPGDGGGTASTAPGAGSTAPGAGSTRAALPPGFPVPPGATVTRSVDDGGEIAATLRVTDPAAATSFWKTALPKAGYTVVSDQSVGGFGEIRFSGHGCGGDSQLAIQGTTVALQCDRG